MVWTKETFIDESDLWELPNTNADLGETRTVSELDLPMDEVQKPLDEVQK